jgi:hypothetical protein
MAVFTKARGSEVSLKFRVFRQDNDDENIRGYTGAGTRRQQKDNGKRAVHFC